TRGRPSLRETSSATWAPPATRRPTRPTYISRSLKRAAIGSGGRGTRSIRIRCSRTDSREQARISRVWTVARCALLALNFLLLSSQSYLLATALVTLLNIALVVIWDFAGSGDARRRAAVAGSLAIAIVAT